MRLLEDACGGVSSTNEVAKIKPHFPILRMRKAELAHPRTLRRRQVYAHASKGVFAQRTRRRLAGPLLECVFGGMRLRLNRS